MLDAQELVKNIMLAPPDNIYRWRKRLYEMRVHTRGEHFMQVLRKHVTEPEDVYEYRRSIFTPITVSYFRKAFLAVSRTMVQSGYNILGSSKLMDFLERRIFERKNFKDWARSRMIPLMLEDPNGYVVCYPLDDSPEVKKREWSIMYMSSAATLYAPYSSGQHEAAFLLYPAEVPYNNTDSEKSFNFGLKPPYSFVIYDDQGVRKVFVGQSNEIEQVVELYTGDGRELLAKMGGIKQDVDGYISYFQHAIPFADNAIRNFSDWQALMSQNGYPIKIVTGVLCDAKGCNRGFVKRNGLNDKCRSCNGTGIKRITTGPMAGIIKPEPVPGQPEDNTPPIQWIEPPSTSINFVMDAWKTMLEYMETALYLKWIEQAQSGIAKAYDKEDFYMFLEQIGQTVYNLLENILSMIVLANGMNRNDLRVIRPSSYALISPSDMNQAITMAQNVGDYSTAQELIASQARNTLGGSLVASIFIKAWQNVDPLFGVPPNALDSWVLSGQFKPAALHEHIAYSTAITRLMREYSASEVSNMEVEQATRTLIDMKDAIIQEMVEAEYIPTAEEFEKSREGQSAPTEQ